MEIFTPVSALIGGGLIGLAAVILMATLGRIAGISGIVSGAMVGERDGRFWRLAFVAGLILAPLVWTFFGGETPQVEGLPGWAVLIGGGLLVGVGTGIGSGCTSGHGVCGISRLSPRSIAATLVFMAAGMGSVALLRPLVMGA